VRALATGDAVLAPAVTRRVIEAFGSLPSPDDALAARLSSLSARETTDDDTCTAEGDAQPDLEPELAAAG
jgi:hypothetical protein